MNDTKRYNPNTPLRKPKDQQQRNSNRIYNLKNTVVKNIKSTQSICSQLNVVYRLKHIRPLPRAGCRKAPPEHLFIFVFTWPTASLRVQSKNINRRNENNCKSNWILTLPLTEKSNTVAAIEIETYKLAYHKCNCTKALHHLWCQKVQCILRL